MESKNLFALSHGQPLLRQPVSSTASGAHLAAGLSSAPAQWRKLQKSGPSMAINISTTADLDRHVLGTLIAIIPESRSTRFRNPDRHVLGIAIDMPRNTHGAEYGCPERITGYPYAEPGGSIPWQWRTCTNGHEKEGR
jgi:hypothetical protein